MATGQKTWRNWCERCGGVEVFKTAKGKAAPYTTKDWTDKAGHTIK